MHLHHLLEELLSLHHRVRQCVPSFPLPQVFWPNIVRMARKSGRSSSMASVSGSRALLLYQLKKLSPIAMREALSLFPCHRHPNTQQKHLGSINSGSSYFMAAFPRSRALLLPCLPWASVLQQIIYVISSSTLAEVYSLLKQWLALPFLSQPAFSPP